MQRHRIEATIEFSRPKTNAFQTLRQGPDSNVTYHCNDVAWATPCLESVSTWLLFKNFILDLFCSMCNLVIRIHCIIRTMSQKCRALIFPLLWAWMNCWRNSRVAGDLTWCLCDVTPIPHYWPFVREPPNIFYSQRASEAELRCCIWCQPDQVVEQTVKLSLIWDATTLEWHHCTGRLDTRGCIIT